MGIGGRSPKKNFDGSHEASKKFLLSYVTQGLPGISIRPPPVAVGVQTIRQAGSDVIRIGSDQDQVKAFRLPPNLSDSRRPSHSMRSQPSLSTTHQRQTRSVPLSTHVLRSYSQAISQYRLIFTLESEHWYCTMRFVQCQVFSYLFWYPRSRSTWSTASVWYPNLFRSNHMAWALEPLNLSLWVPCVCRWSCVSAVVGAPRCLIWYIALLPWVPTGKFT